MRKFGFGIVQAAAASLAATRDLLAANGEVRETFAGMHGAVFIVLDTAIALLVALWLLKAWRNRANKTPDNDLAADQNPRAGREPSDASVADAVCRRRFPRSRAGEYVLFEGRTYYFCSRACREKFEKSPQRYSRTFMAEV